MPAESSRPDARLTSRVILLATVAGFGLAVWQALAPGLPEHAAAAATVNGRVISRADLAQAVEALARDKRNPVSDADRERALDTLITEELLIQRAEEIGLLQSDRMVRSAVVDAMIQTIVAREQAEQPDDATLRRFYDEHPLLGTPSARVRVTHATQPWPATDAVAALRGGTAFETVFGAERMTPLPNGLLRMDALGTYLPPSVLRAMETLAPGEIAGPLRIGDQAHFVWLLDREAGDRPAFERIRTQVAEAWRVRQRERAVVDAVARLRAGAEIRTPS